MSASWARARRGDGRDDRAGPRVGADAILGIDLDYEVLGSNNGHADGLRLGTAVRLKPVAGTAPWARP
jgi:hypothetical protein